jgi:predicted metal-dependent RNase
MKKLFASIITALIFSACSGIRVSEVEGLTGNEEVCIVNNTAVNNSFQAAYLNQVHALGIRTRIVNISNDPSCDIISTYTADYDVDWRTYLRSANLKVYRAGNLVGEASYHAYRSYSRKETFTEKKIGDMVRELFPIRK